MKRVFSLLLSLLILGGCLFTPASAEGSLDHFAASALYADGLFADVSAEDWFYESVVTVYELGLMRGTDTGFNPGGSLSIAESVTLAARLSSLYLTGEESFVQGEPWYQVYVDYAREQGILGAEELDWSAPATRRQVAALLSAALPQEALAPINELEDGAIPDVGAEDESAGAIYLLYRAGVLTGSDGYGSFLPEEAIQRSAVAAIVSRLALPELRRVFTLLPLPEAPQSTEETAPAAAEDKYPDLTAKTRAEDGFFAHSAMVGNSLAQGMQIFSGLKDMSFFDYQSTTVFDPNGFDETRCFDRLLQEQFEQVYMEYGINEIGYPAESFVKGYGRLIDQIRAAMPGVEIYVMAITPVTKAVSDRGSFTNTRISAMNAALRQMCADKSCWYLDCYTGLCDETGYLPESYAGWDGSPHLATAGYKAWAEIIRTYYHEGVRRVSGNIS